jgi:hypothetical protein
VSPRRRLRILAGGVIGGALVLAERRLRRRVVPPGVRAFEDAPCFRDDHDLPPRQTRADAPEPERAEAPAG